MQRSKVSKDNKRVDIQRINLRAARLDIAPIGHVHLVHLGKVVHVGEKDVDLDDLVDTSARSLEDGGQVFDALMLQKTALLITLIHLSRQRISLLLGGTTYSVSLNVARNQLHRLGVHGHGSRYENHAIGLDGLAVDAGKRLGSLVGEDRSLGRGHCDGRQGSDGVRWIDEGEKCTEFLRIAKESR